MLTTEKASNENHIYAAHYMNEHSMGCVSVEAMSEKQSVLAAITVHGANIILTGVAGRSNGSLTSSIKLIPSSINVHLWMLNSIGCQCTDRSI